MKNINLLLALLFLFGCGAKETQTEVQHINETLEVLHLNDTQLRNFKLNTIQIKQEVVNEILKLTGEIDVPPQNLISISVALGGYLKSTRLLPGSHFDKGEVLAVMEDNQYIQMQQDYLTVKAQLKSAQAEYQRQKDLNQSKASSDKTYQQAKSEFEMLEISKAGLEQKLRMINVNPEKLTIDNISRTVKILAPFDGYVTKVLVNIGKYISPSDVMFELVDPRDLHLNLKVFEKDWDKIKVGERVVSYTNTNPDKRHEGELIVIGKNISDDRAVETHAHFEKYDPALIPGMYMNAEIEIPQQKGWTLPEECVLSFEGKKYVFIQKNKNTFEMMAVEIATIGKEGVVIKNGAQLKDLNIVQQGAYTLLMALKNTGEDDGH